MEWLLGDQHMSNQSQASILMGDSQSQSEQRYWGHQCPPPNQTTSTQPREKMNRHDSQLVLRGRIVGLKESGLSIRAIAHRLGISTSTVERWTRRFEESGNLCNLGMYWNFVCDFYVQNSIPNNLCTNYSSVNVLSDPLHRISKDFQNYLYKVFQNSL